MRAPRAFYPELGLLTGLLFLASLTTLGAVTVVSKGVDGDATGDNGGGATGGVGVSGNGGFDGGATDDSGVHGGATGDNDSAESDSGATGDSTARVDPTEHEALIQFALDMDCGNWTMKWNLTEADHCVWSGVSCTYSVADGFNVVWAVIVMGRGASGHIDALCRLTHLRTLTVSHNNVDHFPGCFTDHRTIQHINIASSRLTGSLPPIPPQLMTLDVSSNKLDAGVFWTFLSATNCGHLNLLNMRRNMLTYGDIDALEYCTSLESIDLSENRLNCELGVLQKTTVKVFFGQGNRFSGHLTMPPKATYVDLSDNSLQGTLAPLAHMQSLVYLDLGNNRLQGGIPPSDLTSLKTLDLSQNFLCCDMAGLANMTALTILSLSTNMFAGQAPSLAPFASLTSAALDHNRFTNLDTLTQSIPKLLVSIDLSYNQLQGPLPKWPLSHSLKELNLSNNKMNGSLSAFSLASELSTLIFKGNQLTGGIPETFCTSQSIDRLDLSDNLLSGGIPECLYYVGQSLFLSNNWLTGTLPSLQWPTDMIQFEANDNLLSGRLPDLSNWANLEQLELARNRLTGPIPSTISALQNLVTLNLGGNILSGEIPDSMGPIVDGMTCDLRYQDGDGFVYPLPELVATNCAVDKEPFGGELISIGWVVITIFGHIFLILGISLCVYSLYRGVKRRHDRARGVESEPPRSKRKCVRSSNLTMTYAAFRVRSTQSTRQEASRDPLLEDEQSGSNRVQFSV